ncbi:MAG: hypothetical protein P8X58_06795, partial [Syntrophobacterales bacterium]
MRFSIQRLPRLALLLLLGTVLLLPWTIPLGAQGRPGVPADLQTLITEALQANPEIKEKSQLKTASEESI